MTRSWPALMDGELELPVPPRGDAELLWRQATKNQWDEIARKPQSYAFGPMPKDLNKPSFSRQEIVTAQESRDWHQGHGNSPSLGVWAVSVAEAQEAKLRAVDNSKAEGGADGAPGHCYPDYRTLERHERKEACAVLLRFALRRGEIETTRADFHKDIAAAKTATATQDSTQESSPTSAVAQQTAESDQSA